MKTKPSVGILLFCFSVLSIANLPALELNLSAGPVFDISQKTDDSGDTLFYSGFGPSFTAQLVLDRFGIMAVFEPLLLPISGRENDVDFTFANYSTFLLLNATVGISYTVLDSGTIRMYMGGGVMAKPKIIAGDSVDTFESYLLDAILFLPSVHIQLSSLLFINLATHFGMYFDHIVSEGSNISRDIAFGFKIGIGLRFKT